MATVKCFEELEIWKLAREQAKFIFELTSGRQFSMDSRFKDQINAAAGSVMDNIAEGFERHSKKEFMHFLIIAKGSNGEVRSQLIRSFDRGYITENEMKEKVDKAIFLSRKIHAFHAYLSESNYKAKPTRIKED